VLADLASRSLNCSQSLLDVGRPLQSETEVHDAARLTGLAWPAFENEHISAAWRLGLDEVGLPVDCDDTKDCPVEA